MVTAVEALVPARAPAPLPPTLVPAAFWTYSRAIAGRYEGLSSSYYAECRLGAPRSRRVDLLLAIQRFEGGHPLDRDESLGPLWSAWRTPGSVLSRSPMVWLELDDIHSASPPLPSLSVCLIPGYRNWKQPLPKTDRDRIALAAEAIRLAGGSEERIALASRCIAAFNCIHVSIMAGRDPATHKLYGVVRRDEMRDFLARIGWRGPTDRIAALLEDHFQRTWCNDDIYVDLTLDSLADAGGNKLGLVLPQQHVTCSDQDPARRTLIRHFVDRGLCTTTQAEQLAGWPGRHEVDTRAGWMVVRKWLDFKVVWDPEEGVSLKAYLGFDARPARSFC